MADGERPRIVVSCKEDHVYHISCLNDHRERIMTFMSGNGLYKCPKCRENYSPTVKLYCGACRNSKVSLPLAETSLPSGRIKKEEIRNKYGDCCQNCRVV
jgi:hypothetical protein